MFAWVHVLGVMQARCGPPDVGMSPSFEQHNGSLVWAELPGMQTGFKVQLRGPQSLVPRSEMLRPVANIRATSPHHLGQQDAMTGKLDVVYSKAAPVPGSLCDFGHVPWSLCATESSGNGAVPAWDSCGAQVRVCL